MDIKSVKTDGFEMKYVCFGEGKKTCVILPGLSVQSVTLSAMAVEREYETLKDEFTVYLLDRRENPPEEYTVSDMAKDTAKAFKKLGLEDIYLFGASQGGMMAIITASRCPEMIKKLALCSTAAKIDDNNENILREWFDKAQDGDRTGLYLSFAQKLYPPGLFAKYRHILPSLAKGVKKEELDKFVILVKGTAGYNAEDEFKSIKCPVMLAYSEDDGVLGTESSVKMAEIMKDRPDFRLLVYKNYGHACYDTAPDFREKLKEFFID